MEIKLTDLEAYIIYKYIQFLFYSPDFVSQKITEKISEHYPNACLVMVNNQQLSKSMKQPAIHVMQLHEGKWKIKDKER